LVLEAVLKTPGLVVSSNLSETLALPNAEKSRAMHGSIATILQEKIHHHPNFKTAS
jgi:hypothetical protein